MNDCDRVSEIHLYHDGELPPAEARRVEQHLDGCAACAAELGRLRALSQALAADKPALSPEALARIRRAADAARYAGVSRLLRRLTAAAAVVLLGAGGTLMYRSTRPSGPGAALVVWERAAAGQRPVAASQPAAEQLQLAQWIVNDLSPKVDR